MRAILLAASLAALSLPASASAQVGPDIMPSVWQAPIQMPPCWEPDGTYVYSGYCDGEGDDGDTAAGAAPSLASGLNASLAGAPDAEAARAELSFRPDRKLRKRVTKELRERVREASPKDAGFVDGDVFRLFQGALDQYGLSVDNLADSSTVYLTQVWEAAGGGDADVSRETARAVSRQMAQAYAAIAATEPGLADIALVQEQSDLFLLQAYLIASLHKTYAQPGTDPAARARFAGAMRDLGKTVFGIDLAEATIDERGLIPGEAIGALRDAARTYREERAEADPAGEAARAAQAALGTPCGVEPRDGVERKLLNLYEGRARCDMYDPDSYASFLREVPEGQHYAINYVAWSTGKPLFSADRAREMDGLME